MKKVWYKGLAVTNVIALTIVLSACTEQVELVEDKPLRPVRTMTVYTPDLTRTQIYPAVVDASRKADLSFRVSGEIKEFVVNQGEVVQEGQLIAALDDRDYIVQVNDAQSLLDKAKADYNRAQNLVKTNAISQADFDLLKSQFHSAQARVNTAKNNLEYTQLKASFSGVIAKKHTENFQEIKAGTPVITLHDLTNIYLKIDLPESIMIRMKREDGPPKLSAEFDALDGISFPLTFKEVATQADDITKTYQVTLSMVAPKDMTILPGMTANVKAEQLIDEESAEANFHLPVNIVLKDTQGHYVFVIEQQQDGIGLVRRRNVIAGAITELGLEIFSGIEQGDVLLTAGMSKVSDGMQVKY